MDHPDRKHDRQTHTSLTGSGLFGGLTTHECVLSSGNMTQMVSYGVAIVLAASHGLNKKMVPFAVLFNYGFNSVKLYDRIIGARILLVIDDTLYTL